MAAECKWLFGLSLNLKLPVRLKSMSVGSGGKLEYLESTHAVATRTFKRHWSCILFCFASPHLYIRESKLPDWLRSHSSTFLLCIHRTFAGATQYKPAIPPTAFIVMQELSALESVVFSPSRLWTKAPSSQSRKKKKKPAPPQGSNCAIPKCA